jgi:type IV secretory pathway component VirB8
MNPTSEDLERYDLDGDGKLSQAELASSEKVLQLDKLESQKKMSWLAFWSMIVLTVILILPVIAETKLKTIEPFITMYYICMSGVICAYFGVSGWITKK